MDNSLVGLQEDDSDSFHSDPGVHGEDVYILLCHLQFALYQVPCDLARRHICHIYSVLSYSDAAAATEAGKA